MLVNIHDGTDEYSRGGAYMELVLNLQKVKGPAPPPIHLLTLMILIITHFGVFK